MGAREKLQAGADKVARKLAAKGFREHTLTLYRQVAGNASLGTPPFLDLSNPLVIDPPPKVENVSLRAIEFGGGVLKLGDLRISGLSRVQFDEATLTDPSLVWRVEGPAFAGDYQAIADAPVKCELTEWIVHVERRP